jgi:hypothetical protein
MTPNRRSSRLRQSRPPYRDSVLLVPDIYSITPFPFYQHRAIYNSSFLGLPGSDMGTAISSQTRQTPSQNCTESHPQALPEAGAETDSYGVQSSMREGPEDEDDRYGLPTHSCQYCNKIFSAMTATPSGLLVRLMSCADAKVAAQVCKFFQQILQPWTEGPVSSAHVYLHITTRSNWPGSGYYGTYRGAKVFFVRDKDHAVVQKVALGLLEGIPLAPPYLDSNDDPSLPVNKNTSLWVYPCAGDCPSRLLAHVY